jgi:hypothetical protein
MIKMDIEDLARRIQEYLSAHPHAADSAEGIAKWWLAESVQEPTVGAVELALKELVKRAVVKETTNRDGTKIYERGNAFDSSGAPPGNTRVLGDQDD